MPIRILSAEFENSSFKPEDYPAARLPEVAFAGRSNVGKSSVINALVNQKRLAIASSTPGRTRSVNFFRVRLSPDPRPPEFHGLTCHFVDLPGYGYARVPTEIRGQWQPMVESYLEGNPWLRGLLLLVDARRGVGEEEARMIEYLRALSVPFRVVMTKADKLKNNAVGLNRRRMAEALSLPSGQRPIPFSVPDKRGFGETLDCIAEWVSLGRPLEEVARDLGQIGPAESAPPSSS